MSTIIYIGNVNYSNSEDSLIIIYRSYFILSLQKFCQTL